ncbi:hypothetical protein JCM8115_000809 [Rhodotorula mucilaginosa]
MWGDTFVWDVSTAADLLGTACQDASSAREPIRGSLRRLVGHKGAVFSASFSDSSEYLATCSDDRTIRVWDLRQLDPDFDPSSASGSSALPGINPSAAPHQTLWGHEGRVWRTLFLDSEEATSTVPSSPSRAEERPPALVSIGEDATCRLWRGGDVIKTWRDGHDGRSIWSIAVARLEGDEPTSPERRYVLTGGADGAVRCWPLDPPECTTPPTATPSTSGTRQDQKTPRSKTSKVTALRVVNLPSAAEGLCTETTRQLAVTLSGDGSFRARVFPDASSASSAVMTSDDRPIYSSATFAGSYSSTVIRLLPPLRGATSESTSPRCTLYAFSNRGYLLTATLKVDALGMVEVEGAEETVSEVKANDVEFVDFEDEGDGRKRRRAVDSPLLRETASLQLDRSRPSLLPTTICFLSPDLFLVGSIRGHLSLFHALCDGSGSATTSARLHEIARLEKVHEDTINRIHIRHRESSASADWTAETVARDGASCLVEVRVPASSSETPSLRMVDRRQLTKGWLEDILPNGRYLALVDTRAVVLDRLGQTLESYPSPNKKALWQCISDATGNVHYYRTQEDLLSHIQLGPGHSAPSTILLGGLHGREIRAVAPLAVPGGGVTLVATAAENGLVTISRLTPAGQLEPLYCDRYLPGSYKSLVWSTNSSSRYGAFTLFACGTRASLAALQVTVVVHESGAVGLRVVPDGNELADEGEEIRAMDLATVSLRRGSDLQQLVAVGYSDGIVRTWLHRSGDRTFTPLHASTEESKCILCVETIFIQLPTEETRRVLLITAASDGLLAVRDLSSLLPHPTSSSSSSTFPTPFFSFRPHPSGINSLSVRVSGQRILLATGGDDNALVISTLEVTAGGNGIKSNLAIEVVSQSSLAAAHSSTIQGLDFLDDKHLVTSSVDQRLNLYRFSPSFEKEQVTASLELFDATCLDVADCSAQAVVQRTEGTLFGDRVIVVGIGAEVVSLETPADGGRSSSP